MRTTAVLLAIVSMTLTFTACTSSGILPSGEGGTPSADTASGEATSADSAAATSADAGAPTEAANAEGSGGAGAESSGTPASAGGQQELVASVNGQAILLSDFQRQAWDTQRYFMDQGGIDPNTPEGQSQLLYLRRQVLNDMINQALLEQAAKEMNISATAADAEASLEKYIVEIGGEAKFEESLTETGSTREQVIEMERASLIGKQMLDQIAADVPDKAEFVHARHILCQAANECQDVLVRLDAGEDFAIIAREVSQDQTSKDRGGDLDWVTRGMSSQQLEEAMFALQAGQRSEVVQSDFGYHVIEVIERDPNRALSEAQLIQLKERKLQEWQLERRAQADIVIYVADLKDVMTDGAAGSSGGSSAGESGAATPTPGG
jgi:parvulin-like peptidyl-prolyl isomerase